MIYWLPELLTQCVLNFERKLMSSSCPDFLDVTALVALLEWEFISTTIQYDEDSAEG